MCSQNGSSETIIGEWMEERKLRDQIVLATKVCLLITRVTLAILAPHNHTQPPSHHLSRQYTNTPHGGDDAINQQVNYLGNNLKSMRLSIESSLKNLRTDYVDILYVHYWDLHASVEEVMDGLHQLVLSGKVLYLVRLLSFLHFPLVLRSQTC